MMQRTSVVRSPVVTALLFLFLLAAFLANLHAPLNPLDEGFSVFGADRILRGDIIYKDFWTLYPPGQFLTVAAAFKVFGTNLLVSRLLDIATRLLIVAALYFVTKKLASRLFAWMASLVIAFILATAGYFSYGVFSALAWVFLAVLSTSHYMETCRPRWLFLAGLLTAISAFYRLDFGAYSAVAQVVGLGLFALARQNGTFPKGGVLLAALRDLAPFLAALLVPLLAGYGVVFLSAGFANVVDQIIGYPARLYPLGRLPFQPLIPPLFSAGFSLSIMKQSVMPWLRFYIPLGILIFTLGYAFRQIYRFLRGRAALTRFSLTITLLVVLGGLSFLQALNRYDTVHVLPSTLIILVLLFALVFQFLRSTQNPFVRVTLWLFLAGVSLFYLLPKSIFLLNALRQNPPYGCFSTVPRAACVPIDPGQEKAIQFIAAKTRPDEPIFVGNRRHDVIPVNDVSFYFLAARPSPTSQHYLAPGVATTLPVQEKIVEQIRASQVNWVVIWNLEHPRENNISGISTGVTCLDDFLRNEYVPVADFGMYQIRKNRRVVQTDVQGAVP